MPRVRRRFTAEFKAEAVRLVSRGSKPTSAVARELGVNAELLRRWVREAQPERPRTGDAPESLEAENRRLRRELAQVTEERDILKKATVYFARVSR